MLQKYFSDNTTILVPFHIFSSSFSTFISIFLGIKTNRKIGFYGVFATAGTFYTAALIYGLFFLKEVPQKNEKKSSQLVKKSFCADFFDFEHIRETFLVAFKARVKNRRVKILALMAVIVIVVGPTHGRFNSNCNCIAYAVKCTHIDG